MTEMENNVVAEALKNIEDIALRIAKGDADVASTILKAAKTMAENYVAEAIEMATKEADGA